MSSLTDRRSGRGVPRGYVFFLLFLSYVLTGVTIYRLQSVLSSAMAFLAVDEGQVGVLISITSFVSLFTTILVGFAVMRLGYCRSLTAAMVLELAGMAAALRFPTYAGMFASQLLQGLGNTIIMVCSPSLMQTIYSQEEYAMRSGIVSAGQSAGQGVVFLLLPTLILKAGFLSAWSVFLPWTGLLLILWMILWLRGEEGRFRAARPAPKAKEEAAAPPAERSVFPLRDWRMWLLVSGVLFSMLSSGAALNYTALYLKSVKGFSETAAGNMMFACTVLGVVAAMAGGPLGRRFGYRRIFTIVALLQIGLRLGLVAFGARLPLTLITAATGIPAAAVVICSVTVPRICTNRQYVPVAVSMVSTATTGGLALSSVIFGKLITAIGFSPAFLVFAVVSAAAFTAIPVLSND